MQDTRRASDILMVRAKEVGSARRRKPSLLIALSFRWRWGQGRGREGDLGRVGGELPTYGEEER